jgi:polysaccharide export outer membrane protein
MRIKKYIFHFLYLSFSVFLTLSCGNNKKIIYFNNKEGTSNDSISPYYYSPIYKKNDNLQIIITSSDGDVVKPFILQNQSLQSSNNINSTQIGYIIDDKGEIDFPLIGKIKIEGLNRMQAIDLLKSQLKTYVSDPTISIRVLNFSFTVLGDVRSPNTYTTPKEQITIVEAIGIAGDLTFSAKRKNILIIREENAKREEIRLDLTSKNIHYQEGYFLRQNDIIYVQPNTIVSSSSVVRNYMYFFISSISVITSIFLLISK